MDDHRESPVLLDVPDDQGTFEHTILERLGHRVMECGGPGAEAICPLLSGEACEKFEQARGVVFELDLDRLQHRQIVERYRQLAAEDVPVRVVVRPGQLERYPSLLAGLQVWDHLPTVADLDGFAAAVEAGERFA